MKRKAEDVHPEGETKKKQIKIENQEALIPIELLIEILKFTTASDLLSFALTCKQNSKVLESDSLWKSQVHSYLLQKLSTPSITFSLKEWQELPSQFTSWKDLLHKCPLLIFPNDRERVKNAFSCLRKFNYDSLPSHTCCNTCGWSELKGDGSKVIFWNIQSDNSFSKSSLMLEHPLFCQWAGDQQLIGDICRSRGLEVEQPKDSKSAFIILGYSGEIDPNEFFKYEDVGDIGDGDYTEDNEEDEDEEDIGQSEEEDEDDSENLEEEEKEIIDAQIIKDTLAKNICSSNAGKSGFGYHEKIIICMDCFGEATEGLDEDTIIKTFGLCTACAEHCHVRHTMREVNVQSADYCTSCVCSEIDGGFACNISERALTVKKMPAAIASAVADGKCTFEVTKKNTFRHDEMFVCWDCQNDGMDKPTFFSLGEDGWDEGICKSCAEKCHTGHDVLGFTAKSEWYCDCGAGTVGKCSLVP